MIAALLCPGIVAAQQDDSEKPVFPLENFYAKRKKNPARTFLNKFHFGLSTGYGTTYFSHKLESFGVFQPKGAAPRVFPTGLTAPRYSNWVNKSVGDTLSIKAGDFLVSGDTTKLGFKGHGFNIPIKATVHYEFERYRIGGGYSYEYMHIGQMHPISYKDKISDFHPSSPGGFMQKYFGMLGVSFYRLDQFLFTADANIGGYKPGKNFALGQIKKGVYANVGVTAERDFSEYLRGFVRPSFEIKNYTLNIPEVGQNINHYINAFYLNFGFTYRFPELPKCYNKDCHIQINHAHGDREYRSRRHPIYKKQNPNYGENYPRLIKYKGKNKKALNPY